MRVLILAMLVSASALARAEGPEVGPCVPCDLLFASTGGSDGELFTIDVESGLLSLIGPVASYSDIALTPDGRLFGLGTGGALFELDPCTAEASPVGLVTRRPGATGTTRLDELLVSSSLLQHVDLASSTVTDLPSGGWCGFAAGDLALNPCDGTAWQVSRGPGCPCPGADTLLERVDPSTGDLIEQVTCLPFSALFGMAFDSACNLWLSDAMSESLILFDPVARTWEIVPTEALGGVLGLASVPCNIEGVCDAGGPYAAPCGAPACEDGEALVELDASGSALPSASALIHDWTIRCPDGLVATASGAQVSLCLPAACDETCEVELVSSNLEGRSVSCLTTLRLFDEVAPRIDARPADLLVECDELPPPASPAASDDCDASPELAFTELHIDGRCPGEYALLRSWTARDRCGNAASASQLIAVVDTTPPAIEESAELVACLWPPNHRLVRLDGELFAPSLSEACSGPVTWRIEACLSDEPEDGLGDGRTLDDCRIADDGETLLVRAERLGNEDGRTYSVLVVATDACGNASEPTMSGRIRVAHDRREHWDCLRASAK